jgi:hypothetical protein
MIDCVLSFLLRVLILFLLLNPSFVLLDYSWLVQVAISLIEAASIASLAAPGIFGLEAALPGTNSYLLPGMEARVIDPDTLNDVSKCEKGDL